MIEQTLLGLGWIGMAVSIVGTHYQSKLDMKAAFKWFLAADALLIGIQIYLHVWPQVLLLATFFYMSAKGLLTIKRKGLQ